MSVFHAEKEIKRVPFTAAGGLQSLGTTDAKELRKLLVKPARALLETADGYLAVVNLHHELRLQRGPHEKGVERGVVETLTGRLGHIAQVAVEGNAYLQPFYAM